MAQRPEEAPVNPLPPVVVALFLLIAGLEGLFSLGAEGIVGGPGAVGWRIAALERYGFSGEVFRWMLETGQFPPEHLLRLVSYPFLHGSFTHAAFAAVMLLAMGKMVGEALGDVKVLVIFVVSAMGGALVFALFTSDRSLLFGAFPAIYGLIGAFTYLLWLRLGEVGEQQLRAFTLIGVLLGLQLLFGLFFGGGPDWIADIGGFVVGFALTILLVPGGWARLRDRLRHR